MRLRSREIFCWADWIARRLGSLLPVRYLLDTHIWIWAVGRPDQLGRRLRCDLERAEVFLSPVSIWEARLLERKGRIETRPTFERWLEQALHETPLQEASFTWALPARWPESAWHSPIRGTFYCRNRGGDGS